MIYGEVPGVGKKVSRILLGTMIINKEDESGRLLDAALQNGINSFDSAHGYGGGESERGLGKWMKDRGNRDDIVILSKCCHPNQDRKRVTPFDISADIHDSLARLESDYIDIEVLHRDNTDVPVGEIVDALNQHMQAGRIRAFGGSNWTAERIQQANDYAEKNGLTPFHASSPNYGLAEQVENPWGPGCVSLSGPAMEKDREWYKNNGLAIFAYSSLGRGLFSGRVTRDNYKDVADGACQKAYCHEVNFQRLDRARELAEERGVTIPQIAMAYVAQQPLNVFPIVGAASSEECQANAAALEIELTDLELAWLDLRSDSRK